MANVVFGQTIMTTELRTAAEFYNASHRLQSAYDLAGTTTNHTVRQRCLKQLNAAGADVEALVRGLWLSTHKALAT